MLFLISTPIGNLADITFRAVDTLKKCDYVLCEDTRKSQILFSHYQISTPLKSFHKFNEASLEEKIIQDLKKGLTIGLISDAGTPGISDPGGNLVKRCIQENLQVEAIPGACAPIAALITSGFDTSRFQFYGFLPKKEGELRKAFLNFLAYPGTTICFESPNRIKNVLLKFSQIAPKQPIGIARELTKKFEEKLQGPSLEIYNQIKDKEIKGEIVLLFSGSDEIQKEQWSHCDPKEHVKFLQEYFQLEKKEAIKLASQIRGVPKKNLYF